MLAVAKNVTYECDLFLGTLLADYRCMRTPKAFLFYFFFMSTYHRF